MYQRKSLTILKTVLVLCILQFCLHTRAQDIHTEFVKTHIVTEKKIGDSIFNLHQYKNALEHYENSIYYVNELKKNDSAVMESFYETVSQCYNMEGNCEFNLHNICKAAKLFELSASIDFMYSKNVMDYLEMSDNEEGAARLYEKCGNLNKALELYQYALEYCEKTKNIVSNYSQQESRILDGMGDIYHKQGNDVKASSYYQKSIQMQTSKK